jgi:uncharacterized protein
MQGINPGKHLSGTREQTMNLPELGVGLTFFQGLEPVLESEQALIDVIEVEPQSLWRRDHSGQTVIVDEPSLHLLRSRTLPKLVHSVGLPVGGTEPPKSADVQLLRHVARELNSPWVSEHLSFNTFHDENGTWHTGFLLPPRQTLAGIDHAVRSIRSLSSEMPVPVAIETGVNYLQPRADEIPDGEFVARVAEGADCGILLDLHNIWTNHRNGRQSVGEYIDHLPLERVWQIHLAGGSSHRGYWIDAHSGAVPAELLELATRIVPRLPNLKAIVFELFPAYLSTVGYALFRTQLEALHRLWDRRGINAKNMPRVATEVTCDNPAPDPQVWEETLGSLTVHKPCTNPLAGELRHDAGLSIIREMVEQLRGSMIVRTLRLSSRLIMLERGTGYLEELLSIFWRNHPPNPFPLDEAEAFAGFLRERKPYVPFLDEVLEYDRAVIDVALKGGERLIAFRADPLPLLRALGSGRRPAAVAIGNFQIRLTPDEIAADARTLGRMQVIH